MRIWRAAGVALLIAYHASPSAGSDFSLAGERVRYEAKINPSHYTLLRYTDLEKVIKCDGINDNAEFLIDRDSIDNFEIIGGKCIQKFTGTSSDRLRLPYYSPFF